jgi:hypothetical protein
MRGKDWLKHLGFCAKAMYDALIAARSGSMTVKINVYDKMNERSISSTT